MAFQFPINPTVGQVFTPSAGVNFKWDGTGWAPFTTAENLAASLGAALVGMMAWRHTVDNISWLVAAAQNVSKAQYPRLWTYAQSFLTTDQGGSGQPGYYMNIDANTFRMPNLTHGGFIRTMGEGGRVLGTYQSYATRDHTHDNSLSQTPHAHNHSLSTPSGNAFGFGGGGAPQLVDTFPVNSTTDAQNANISINNGAMNAAFQPSIETRPVNTALYLCVFTGVFA